jgi:hypothetical protein
VRTRSGNAKPLLFVVLLVLEGASACQIIAGLHDVVKGSEPDSTSVEKPDAQNLDEPDARNLDEPDARNLDEPDAQNLDEPDAQNLDEPDSERLDPCQSCTLSQCADAAAACADLPECNALATCLADCDGGAACRAQCTVDNGVGPLATENILAGALNACLAKNCESQCGLTCGGLSLIAPPAAAPGCEACIQTHDCTTAETWASYAPSDAYFLCRENCRTGDCVGACLEIDGGNSFFQLFTPVSFDCSDPCQIGENWECLGRFQWPLSPDMGLQLTLSLATFLSGAPVAGAAVTMCAPSMNDYSDASADGATTGCADPVTSGTTDDAGAVTFFYAPLNRNGMSPGGINGFLDLTSSNVGLYPTLVYWGFPFVSGLIADAIRVFPASDWQIAAVPTINAAAGPLDPSRGVVVAAVLDCFGDKARNVTVALSGADDAGSTPYYLRSPSGGEYSLASGPGESTDTNAAAVFVNVPPGLVDVIATPVSVGRPSSRASVLVRAGTLTEVNLQPTPDPGDPGDAQVE